MAKLTPIDPLRVGVRTFPLALPPFSTRLSLIRVWSTLTPDGAEELPTALQHLLSFAALGLCVEAGKAQGAPRVFSRSLAECTYDFVAYGQSVADDLEEMDGVEGPELLTEADRIASDVITSTYTPKPEAVQKTADFSEAEPAPASSPDLSPPTAGSAPPSPGAN